MNGDFSFKHQAMTIGSLIFGLAAGSVLAADLNNVKITNDQNVGARTNMPPRPPQSGILGVSFDADVAQRTNMQRQPGDVAPVTVTQDTAVMERTNMNDMARTMSAPPKVEASSK